MDENWVSLSRGRGIVFFLFILVFLFFIVLLLGQHHFGINIISEHSCTQRVPLLWWACWDTGTLFFPSFAFQHGYSWANWSKFEMRL